MLHGRVRYPATQQSTDELASKYQATIWSTWEPSGAMPCDGLPGAYEGDCDRLLSSCGQYARSSCRPPVNKRLPAEFSPSRQARGPRERRSQEALTLGRGYGFEPGAAPATGAWARRKQRGSGPLARSGRSELRILAKGGRPSGSAVVKAVARKQNPRRTNRRITERGLRRRRVARAGRLRFPPRRSSAACESRAGCVRHIRRRCQARAAARRRGSRSPP